MKHGDISNQGSYSIAFRVEGFLLEYKDSNIIDKILNIAVGKNRRATINEKVLSAINYIYRETEFTILLVIQEGVYTPTIKKIFEDIPFSSVVLVKGETQITGRILSGDISYYVDNDLDRISHVNSQYAVTLDQIENIIKRRTKH